jgi:hypothetical protein
MNVRTYCFDVILERHFKIRKELGWTRAATKEEFFGFEANEIIRIYDHRRGFGSGLFFRLRDGRVMDSSGRECNDTLTSAMRLFQTCSAVFGFNPLSRGQHLS